MNPIGKDCRIKAATQYWSVLIALSITSCLSGCVATKRAQAGTESLFQQRALHQTGCPLDVAIEGNGFFRLNRHDGSPDEIVYTRRGSFLADDRGQLLLTSSPEYRLDPPILIPLRVTELTVSQDGQISCIQAGNPERMVVGQIQLSQFANPNGLKPVEEGLYIETNASGKPMQSKPGDHEAGIVLQGYLEAMPTTRVVNNN